MAMMPDRVIMTRPVRGRAPGREIDIAFWQALGPTRLFEADWDLVVTAAAVKGIHEDRLRLQRSVTKRKRRRRPMPDRGRLRGDGIHGTALDQEISAQHCSRSIWSGAGPAARDCFRLQPTHGETLRP